MLSIILFHYFIINVWLYGASQSWVIINTVRITVSQLVLLKISQHNGVTLIIRQELIRACEEDVNWHRDFPFSHLPNITHNKEEAETKISHQIRSDHHLNSSGLNLI